MARSKSHYHTLRSKLVKRHQTLQSRILEKHRVGLTHAIQNAKGLAFGSVGGLILLTSAHIQSLPHPSLTPKQQFAVELDSNVFLLADLKNLVPQDVRPLTNDEETVVTKKLSNYFGIPVKAEIQGLRLNRSYGYIGAEQHLARYPGDTMASHFDNPEDAAKYYSSGMAPGLGGWGYFTDVGDTDLKKATEREKYYIAVQSFLSPDFAMKVREYRDFYRFRKMLVVNPDNGKAMVVVVGDAGPASWTGKSLGGSPEVMKYLERVDGRARGAVLYFFIDDPDDTIPLGPIEPKGEASDV